MSDLEGRARREADDYQVNDWLIYRIRVKIQIF